MLTDQERHALDLAATPFRYPAVRESRALDELGLTPTSFWSLVVALLDRPDAEAEMPGEVRRLRRVLATRAAARRGVVTC